MKINAMSRRMFLQGLGRTLPMPFLVSLLPRELWAQSSSATTIKRYVAIACNYDYGRHSNWYPSLAQPAQKLVSATGDRTLSYAPLSSYLSSSTSSLSTVFGNSLNPYINQISLLRGLDQSTRIGHGNGHIWGNIAATDGHDSNSAQLTPLRTIDQVLRDNLRFNSINRDVVNFGYWDSRSYRLSNGVISLANLTGENPRQFFNYLFDSGRLAESGSTTVTAAHPRKDVLSSVMEDYTRIRNGSQISASDRISLDNALDLISDINKGLQGSSTTVVGGCSYKTINTTGDGDSYFTSTATLSAYAKIIAAAMMCDVARVFNFAAAIDDNAYDRNPTEDFHQGHSHIPFTVVNGTVNWQYMGQIQNAFVRTFIAPLISNLASATDPTNGKSYLYNSLVHYTLECSQVHGLNSQPCMFAGNAGGSLTSGYYLDYTDRSRIHPWCADSFTTGVNDDTFSHEYVGVPLNRVFNTVLQAMGLSPTEYENSSINGHFQNVRDGRYGALNNNISNLGGYGWWGPASSSYGTDYMARQALFDLTRFKDVLPFPATSAG